MMIGISEKAANSSAAGPMNMYGVKRLRRSTGRDTEHRLHHLGRGLLRGELAEEAQGQVVPEHGVQRAEVLPGLRLHHRQGDRGPLVDELRSEEHTSEL